jgi:cobalt/nickel transport system permease protein
MTMPSVSIASVDLRWRLAAAFVLPLIFSACVTGKTVAACLVISLCLFFISGLPPRSVLGKLTVANFFAMLIVATMPLGYAPEAGFVWRAELFPVALLVGGKINAAVIAFHALLGQSEPERIGLALRGLGAPEKLARIFLFAARYLDVMKQEYLRLRVTLKARGFVSRCDFRTLHVLGNLMGILFIRSIERSERVLAAMKCRGFDGQARALSSSAFSRRDLPFLLLVFLAATALIVLEISCRTLS